MKLVSKVFLGLSVAAVGMQLIRPSQTNPSVTAEIQAPPEVSKLLHRACYDCHSNETKWPWYSQVAPVMWLVTRDVNEGRRELNFSEFKRYEVARQKKKLQKVVSEVEEGEMPIAIYPPLHPEAKLTADERKQLTDWAKGAYDSLQ